MEELKLILPTIEYKEQIEEYKRKMLEAGSSMDGCGPLRHDDFETWLKKCNDWRKGENLPDGFVQATQYICVRKKDNKIVGMLQIRHKLNDHMLSFAGHIGDSVAVDERRKGYEFWFFEKIQMLLPENALLQMVENMKIREWDKRRGRA